MNNKISNHKVNVPNSIEMNDKDYLSTLLEIEKNLSNNISTALNEASCDKLFNALFLMFTEIKGLARDLYEMIFDCGWYSLEKVNDTEIKEILKEFETNLKQLI